MCGLLGFSGKNNYNVHLIRLLFFANETRGIHSSGYYSENKNFEFKNRLFKEIGKVSETMLPRFNPKPDKLFIGHTRAATVGEKTLDNAHPFMFDNVVGAHNGTLKNHKRLLKEYNEKNPELSFNDKVVTMDSKLFFHYFNVLNDFKVLKDFDGAAALIWRDNRDKEDILHIWKNNDRPLHYGYVDDDMYISSEKFPLDMIMCKDIKAFTINKHYQIVDGKIISEDLIVNSPKIINNVNSVAKLSGYKNCAEMSKDMLEYLNISKSHFKYHILTKEKPISSVFMKNEKGMLYKYATGEEDLIVRTKHAKDEYISSVCEYNETLSVFTYSRKFKSGTVLKRLVYMDNDLGEDFWDFVAKKREGLLEIEQNDITPFDYLNDDEEDDEDEDDFFIQLGYKELSKIIKSMSLKVSNIADYVNASGVHDIKNEIVELSSEIAEFQELINVDIKEE